MSLPTFRTCRCGHPLPVSPKNENICEVCFTDNSDPPGKRPAGEPVSPPERRRTGPPRAAANAEVAYAVAADGEVKPFSLEETMSAMFKTPAKMDTNITLDYSTPKSRRAQAKFRQSQPAPQQQQPSPQRQAERSQMFDAVRDAAFKVGTNSDPAGSQKPPPNRSTTIPVASCMSSLSLTSTAGPSQTIHPGNYQPPSARTASSSVAPASRSASPADGKKSGKSSKSPTPDPGPSGKGDEDSNSGGPNKK